jgi:hypothetical protein
MKRILTAIAVLSTLLLQGCPDPVEGTYACSQTCGGFRSDWGTVCAVTQFSAERACTTSGQTLCSGVGMSCPSGCQCYAELLREVNCNGVCATSISLRERPASIFANAPRPMCVSPGARRATGSKPAPYLTLGMTSDAQPVM